MDRLTEELKAYISKMKGRYAGNLTEEALSNLYSVYPFNKFEYAISHLIAEKVITIEEYSELRSSYLNRNRYLYVFEMTAPRSFGEQWTQRHLNEVVPELQRPTRSLDADYNGQYDFWYEGIRIEVKASRAVRKQSGKTLMEKALSRQDTSSFDMNFQQLKPSCCDVFVWIGVWKDEIVYWVLSSKDVEDNDCYSKGQHRGNTGEGQLWIKHNNIRKFDKYRTDVRNILNRITEAKNKAL